jgi:MFS family permease
MPDIDAGPSSVPSGSGSVTSLPFSARAAVIAGNWLEFYDFIVYTFFAVMIGDAFFPGHSQTARLLESLATFGVGFLTRPLGAAVIGAYADKAGRRAAMTLTLLLMAVGTGLVGLTPSYTQIGMAAPIILVIARLIQGFSCGGELGPATTYLLESAPVQQRASLTAWQGYSQGLASITGSLVGLILAAALSKHDLYAWGWRLPFLIGIVVAPLGMYIRARLPETLSAAETHASSRAVLGALLRRYKRSLLLGVLIISGVTIATYVFHYMTTFAITTLHLSAAVGTSITLMGSIASFPGLALGVYLDRFGRKRVLVWSRVLFIAMAYPVFKVITTPGTSPAVIIAVNMSLSFVMAVGVGGLYAFLPEAFPKAVRSSGLSILYALSVTIFGGTTQFVVAWLISVTGDAMVPAWYEMIAMLVSIGAIMLLMPDAEAAREHATAGVRI